VVRTLHRRRGIELNKTVSKGRGLIPPSPTSPFSSPSPSTPDDEARAEPQLGASTLYSPENMHVMIFDWLNATFPNGGRNRFVNGAQGGVGSGYFGWCFSEC
jgi:hypothetical protein